VRRGGGPRCRLPSIDKPAGLSSAAALRQPRRAVARAIPRRPLRRDGAPPQGTAAQSAILRGPRAGRAAASEFVNLSILALFDMSEIKDLAWPETPKIRKIHKLSG
jgi:hypothetical protein